MSHPLRRLFEHARPYRREVAIASLFSVLNKIFDVLPEILIGMAVDVVVSKKSSFLGRAGVSEPHDQLLLLAALTVSIWVCESLFEYLYALRWRNLAQNLQHDLRMEAYRHVQRLELAWFEQRRTGSLMSILNDDINQMERFLNGGANDLIQVVTGSALVGAVFFGLTKKVAVLALIPIPLIVYGAFWFQARLASRYALVRDAAGSLNSRLNNNLLGIATIKAYTAEDFEAKQVRAASSDYRAANSSAIRFSAAITPIIRMAILAGFTVTLLYGGFLALRGEIGVGSYSVLVYLTQRLLWPMTRLADMTDLYQRSMASVERVMNLLETPIAIGYDGKPLDARSRARRTHLRSRPLRLCRTPHPERRVAADRGRTNHRLRWQHRQRQEHSGQATPAFLRTAVRRYPARRCADRRRLSARLAARHRLRGARQLSGGRQRGGEHRLRPAMPPSAKT